MKVLTKEEREFTRQTATFNVYYDNVKESFLKKDWNRLKNKTDIVYSFYMNGISVFEAFKQIRMVLKKK